MARDISLNIEQFEIQNSVTVAANFGDCSLNYISLVPDFERINFLDSEN